MVTFVMRLTMHWLWHMCWCWKFVRQVKSGHDVHLIHLIMLSAAALHSPAAAGSNMHWPWGGVWCVGRLQLVGRRLLVPELEMKGVVLRL